MCSGLLQTTPNWPGLLRTALDYPRTAIDCSRVPRSVPDYTALLRTAPDYSQLARITPDCPGLPPDCYRLLQSASICLELHRTSPDCSGLLGRPRTAPTIGLLPTFIFCSRLFYIFETKLSLRASFIFLRQNSLSLRDWGIPLHEPTCPNRHSVLQERCE